MVKERMNGGMMEKTLIGCAIGLLAGPALAVIVVTGAVCCSGGEWANYAFLFGLLIGLPAGLLVGPYIGAVIGALLGWRKMDKASRGLIIGFLVGPVLGFLVATGVFSGSDNVVVANLAWVLGLLCGPAWAADRPSDWWGDRCTPRLEEREVGRGGGHRLET
jgi:MFS family permease